MKRALLLLALPLLARARVLQEGEEGFAECARFFPGEQPPEGFAEAFHAQICQRRGGEPRFATLYSPRDKIPVYSAFRPGDAAGTEAWTWLVEPQLDDPDSNFGEALSEEDAANSVDGLGTQQALIEDYASSGYQPQPLNPSCMDNDNSQTAAFALTDTVPVTQGFAEGWSEDVELIGERLAQLCGDDLYFIAGAVPSDFKIKDKISVPEFLWLAACCNTPEAWSMGFVKQMADRSSLESVTMEELQQRLPGGGQVFMSSCNEDSRTAEQKGILQTINQQKSTQTMPTGPFFRTVQFIACILFGIVKSVFYVLWFILEQLYNLVSGRLCCLWNGVTTYTGAVSAVLFSIPYDTLRVIGNVLCGFVKILDNVLTAVGAIVSVPVHFLLDIASFPVDTICAVPTVGKDIASGICGSFSLIISAVVGFVDCSFCVVSYGLKKFIQRSLGQTESYDDS
uniref:Endonuclease domain-containing 1 protein n=1 Tax=Geotrypetes seraphini TaxID=260995 RepID=A0A6P8QZU7_GEOSA|nr:endonuclease domain-containing 1 protein [Geotrypetes seraphini]